VVPATNTTRPQLVNCLPMKENRPLMMLRCLEASQPPAHPSADPLINRLQGPAAWAIGQKPRPRKLRRDRCKRYVQQLLEMLTAEQGPCEVINAIQAEAQRSKYSRSLCQSLLDDWLFTQNGDVRTCLAQNTVARTAKELEHDRCRAAWRFSV
ncbi:unnamed protein product, partial [Cladocopium goreaui]